MGTWTDDDTQKLKALFKTHTLEQLAEVFGLSPDAMRHQIRKHQLHKGRLPPHARPISEVREIANYSDQHGVKAAAQKFGLSQHVVKNIRRRHVKTLTKRLESISEDKIQSFRRQAIGHAMKKGYGQYAEDYASHACILLLEGKFTRHDWIFVDFLRATFGSVKTKKGSGKVRAESYAEELDNVEVEAPTQTNWLKLANELNFSNFQHRIAFLLVYQWGFGYNEVADLFGVTGSAVSIMMSIIHSKLKDIDPSQFQHEPIVKVVKREE